MTRTASPSLGLVASLAAVLLAFAVGPTAGAVAGTLGDDDRGYCERMGHTMPGEMPSDEMPSGEAPGEGPVETSTCCVSAPEAPRDAVVPSPTPALTRTLAAAAVALAPVPAEAPQARSRDTGPPPGPRLHLAHSVFLV